MVQTRSASSSAVPRLSPPPPPSPTKRRAVTRSTSVTPAPASATALATAPEAAATPAAAIYSHTPSTLALAWLVVSLPLVAWDTGYVMLRPHSMPGGAWHAPWKPYDLYGRVDHVYGFKRWDAGDGFCGAQGTMNIVESLMYLVYAYIWYANRTPAQPGTRAAVSGRPAAVAVLIMFSACVMTVSKTVLYWLNESWSGFDNIGHNSARDLIVLWIIPNGLWIVFPSYLIYTYGSEIIDAMAASPGRVAQKTE